ncbi:MAG: cytochrome c biogenesis protein ResB, partial [Ruminiclostridium sp.]|nr:cytochrome c biogenesis protein ResB [Ruminiclostridium sp.]
MLICLKEQERRLKLLEKNSSSYVNKIWNLFSSMKFGLTLLGIIAVTAGIGTVIPQEAGYPAKAEGVNIIWQALGFTHIYNTFYFHLLLGLLCMNLVVCNVQRFKGIYHRTFRPNLPEGLSSIPQIVRCELEGSNSGLKQALQKTLRARGYFLMMEDSKGGWNSVGIKRRWGNWGSFLTHAAFIILIFGALIGSVNGFKGFLFASVGTINPIRDIQVQKGRVTENFSVKINSFEPRFLPNGDRDNWYTDLSIIDEKGAEVARRIISTNHPFTYGGVTFYQSAWAVKTTLEFDGQKYSDNMYEGTSTGLFKLPGTDISLNFGIGRNLRQPGIYYQARKGSKQVQEGQIPAGQTVDIQGKCKVTVEG